LVKYGDIDMHKICRRVVSTVVIIVALALAIIVSIWHKEALNYIIFVSRFFDVMIPVLAVGALIKYLICGSCHDHDSNSKCSK
jgi:hypothetical protein